MRPILDAAVLNIVNTGACQDFEEVSDVRVMHLDEKGPNADGSEVKHSPGLGGFLLDWVV